MNKLLFFFVIGFCFVGCGVSKKPLQNEPSEAVLLGVWKLRNSPSKPEGSPVLPKPNETYFHLKPGSITEVHGILIEERIIVHGQVPKTRWLLKTGEGYWTIDSLPQKGYDKWRVEMDFQLWQDAIFEIYRNGDGRLELHYSPDPEMPTPFIFIRDEVKK